MADLYPNQSPTNSYQPQSSYHHRPQDSQPQPQQPYHHLSSPAVVYPPRLLASSHSSPDDTASHNSPPKTDSAAHSPQLQQQHHSQHQQGQQQQQQQQNNMTKTDTKPQATFLTKLYALLERPENHHMIRWDPAGEHIIVERPEQLALHVLPSIYRQSRFASFSRQLNIYGFMRKVNLRNVDPAIDDPDASTWSHPTLNRHSPPEVVANFKRRVPPRLPKPRKRPDAEQNPAIPPPRSASGLGTVPLTIPSSLGLTSSPKGGRARGFSAPGSYQPLPQAGPTSQWGNTYNRALPPLTVPSDPPLSHGGMYPSSHALHPVSPADDHGSFNSLHYPPNREPMVPSSAYPYPEQNNWSFSPISSGSGSSHSGSLTSLLNPPSNGSGYPPTRPTINTSYPSSLSSVSMQHSASSLSPDSRPATGYSVSSMSSLPYDDNHHYPNDYSRPGSGHHRPITPTSSRPPSSKSSYAQSTLSVRRQRRHSQAVNPYPTPYEQHMDNRPSSSPQPGNGEDHALHRSRSMIQLPTVDTYSHYGSNQHQHQADFAYSAGPLGTVGAGGTAASLDQTMDDWNSRSVRPSTSASSLSAASQTSSSQAHTPPVTDNFEDTGVHRFSPDLGYVPMNEHITQYDGKAENVYGAETGSVLCATP
ncbi:HSF-type DNA-binding-domain-containing protein [Russula brevipes]|nr:HSF-type DNA-binding-domain-containing protein [Russula brevipes]